jgi:hypothetical protein
LAHAAGIEDGEVPRQQAVTAEAQQGFWRRVCTHPATAASGEDQSMAEGAVRLHAKSNIKRFPVCEAAFAQA